MGSGSISKGMPVESYKTMHDEYQGIEAHYEREKEEIGV